MKPYIKDYWVIIQPRQGLLGPTLLRSRSSWVLVEQLELDVPWDDVINLTARRKGQVVQKLGAEDGGIVLGSYA